MSSGTIATRLANMVPALAGNATPKVIFESSDGVLVAYGTVVPADATVGYAPGSIFMHTDGNSIVTVVYFNIGTKASCNFDPVVGTVTQQAHIQDPAACAAMTATLAGVDTGTDMTAAQAATIVADLAALKTSVDLLNANNDAILAALETAGVLAAA